MAFEEVGIGGKEFVNWTQCEAGHIVEGEFVKTIDGRFGDEWEVQGETVTYVLNNAGQLAHKMKFVKPGDLVQVHYLGKETIQTGKSAGKEAHQFKVLVDKSGGDKETPF